LFTNIHNSLFMTIIYELNLQFNNNNDATKKKCKQFLDEFLGSKINK